MGTAIVGLVLVAVVAAIIVSLAKNKKKGKSSCGCGSTNCAHCAAGCSHKVGEVSPSLQPASQSYATPSPKGQSPLKSPVDSSQQGNSPRVSERNSLVSDSERPTPPSAHTTILEIDGMMCGMCESHVNDAIRNNFSVKSVKSSHKTGITQIVSEEPLDEEKLRSVIKETGYELKNISAN